MAQLEHLQVFQSMHSSPNTRLHRSAELGNGLAAAVWSNRHDARDYQAPSHHTLSCYLAGGTGTFRRESPHSKGAPDKLCILPAGHQSAWVINGEIQLAHLYISQEQFALAAVNLLDREPRELELREGTFLDDAQQARRFRQLSSLDWSEPGERLLSSSLAHGLINHALLSQVGRREGLRGQPVAERPDALQQDRSDDDAHERHQGRPYRAGPSAGDERHHAWPCAAVEGHNQQLPVATVVAGRSARNLAGPPPLPPRHQFQKRHDPLRRRAHRDQHAHPGDGC